EHDEPLRRYARRRDGPANCLNPHPANGDFRGVGVGIMGAYVSPIKLRNCYAEIAILKLHIEIGGMQQQIRAVQRHAEIDSNQAARKSCPIRSGSRYRVSPSEADTVPTVSLLRRILHAITLTPRLRSS